MQKEEQLMTTHGTVRKMTDGQRGDLVATMAAGIPLDFSFDEAQAIIGAKTPFIAEIRDVFNRRRSKPGLFDFIGTVVIPATSVPFVARDKFVVGNAGIVYVSEQFKTWFSGKTEKPIAEAALRYAKLTRSSLDGPILAELGDKAETTLSQIWALMELQPNGEEGVLLTNGWANIFYVNGRAVGVYRDDGGWGVGASSVTDPGRWDDEGRVFSRDS